MSIKKANFLLVLVTVAWGASYLFTKTAVMELEPFTLIAYRFLIAFVITAIVFWKRIKQVTAQTILASSLLGSIMALVCILFGYALRITDASVAGFLIATTVIIIPLLMIGITRKLPTRQVITGGIITLVGLGLLSLKGSFSISFGMALCLITAFLYAVHIILNNHFVLKHDSLQLGVFQLFFTGFFSLIGALLNEPLVLPQTANGWGSLFMLAIFCSAFAIILQSIAQKYTNAVSTGFIFSLEPIFAAMFAFVFLNERMNGQEMLGALFIFVGVLAANYTPPKVRKLQVNMQN
ncbi:DMT family transporter [Solibacillus daqui]|uniref:DMT family transporter n=1 Tax=Solibacillus daqui TaxID=2912187 RepID=UPI0023654399|nr:DMT family transporter [Solibacillus daqui]